MNNELIKTALSTAYSLLCDEAESVCIDELADEYKHTIDLLRQAIEEIEI